MMWRFPWLACRWNSALQEALPGSLPASEEELEQNRRDADAEWRAELEARYA